MAADEGSKRVKVEERLQKLSNAVLSLCSDDRLICDGQRRDPCQQPCSCVMYSPDFINPQFA